jgi:hypothetical protein
VIAADLGGILHGLDVLFGGGQVVEVVENWNPSCSGVNADGSLEFLMMVCLGGLYGIGKVLVAASEMGLGLAVENLGWVSVKSAVIYGSNGGEKSPTSLVKLEMN